MTKTRLTTAQRSKLQWLAANPKRYLVAYGQQTKVAHALLRAGLVKRDPDQFEAFRITEKGKAEAAQWEAEWREDLDHAHSAR